MLYQADNILKVELDLPNRTTRDYKAPAVKSSLQAALDIALQEEEEMIFDAMYVVCDPSVCVCVCVCMLLLLLLLNKEELVYTDCIIVYDDCYAYKCRVYACMCTDCMMVYDDYIMSWYYVYVCMCMHVNRSVLCMMPIIAYYLVYACM